MVKPMVKLLVKVAGVVQLHLQNQATQKLGNAFEIVGLLEKQKDKNDAQDELLVNVLGAISSMKKVQM